MNILEMLKSGTIIIDGAMGTMLQKSGLPVGERPELLNITHPEIVANVHKAYVDSGSKITYANTFGANAHKLSGSGATPKEVITAGIKLAKEAVEGKALVALDIGPIGELLEPAGSLSFEDAYELYKEQMIAGKEAGADLIAIETMTDLYEVKAAILAAKENTDLPVFVTMTFDENGRTFTGCSVSAMALLCEGLGVDACGFNCSLGPIELLPLAKELAKWTRLPLIIKPNAGLPDPATGKYDITASEFAQAMKKYLSIGVSVLGGCCGTTPEYISALCSAVGNEKPAKREMKPVCAICTPTKTVISDGVRMIGERINPTGKKRFKQALIEKDFDYILSQGIQQASAGADVLDVNVGLPDIDEPVIMKETVKKLQSVLDLPLCLDSSDLDALENGLRIYNGKPLVNSVNGEDKSLHSVLPLIKKYGAAVIGLTLDENGIPPKAEDRFKIAEKIMKTALSYGIPKENIVIDCLTLTVSVQQKEAQETLKAVHMVKEKLGLKTVLGVSNISFGLPNRELITRTFLLLAMNAGLDFPIINPNIEAMTDTISAFNVLANRDVGSTLYVKKYSQKLEEEKQAKPTNASTSDPKTALFNAVRCGIKHDAIIYTEKLSETEEPMKIVDDVLIPALDDVGKEFEKGVLFLPQLLQAASASQEAFSAIKTAVAKNGSTTESKGKVILATVKGDIHDIGKNIVKTLLENYGFNVIDLGRDVEPKIVLETAKSEKVNLIGLSALMTTTLKSMEETIKLLKNEIPNCCVMVGGAVLTPDYAIKIGADFYSKDARQSVEIAKKYYNN